MFKLINTLYMALKKLKVYNFLFWYMRIHCINIQILNHFLKQSKYLKLWHIKIKLKFAKKKFYIYMLNI